MTSILQIGVLIATVLLTLAVGLELDRTAIMHAIRLRNRLWVLWILQTVIPPAIALIIVSVIDLPVHIEAGFLLLAACPVGDIANVYTMLARGPVACSILISAASCLTAPLTMAATFAVYDLIYEDSFTFAIPTITLVVRVFLLAVLPIIAGAFLRSKRPRLVDRIRPWVRRICGYCIAMLIAYIVISQYSQFITEFWITAITAFAFLFLTMLCGWWSGRGLRLNAPESACTAFLVGVRNLGMLAAVAIVLLGHTEYAVFGAVYFLIEVPVALALITWTCRHTKTATA